MRSRNDSFQKLGDGPNWVASQNSLEIRRLPLTTKWRGIVMRVYFNLADGANSITDPDGLEVLNLDQAYTEAEQVIAEIFREDPTLEAGAAGWRLDAADSSGAVLFSINFDSVIH